MNDAAAKTDDAGVVESVTIDQLRLAVPGDPNLPDPVSDFIAEAKQLTDKFAPLEPHWYFVPRDSTSVYGEPGRMLDEARPALVEAASRRGIRLSFEFPPVPQWARSVADELVEIQRDLDAQIVALGRLADAASAPPAMSTAARQLVDVLIPLSRAIETVAAQFEPVKVLRAGSVPPRGIVDELQPELRAIRDSLVSSGLSDPALALASVSMTSVRARQHVLDLLVATHADQDAIERVRARLDTDRALLVALEPVFIAQSRASDAASAAEAAAGTAGAQHLGGHFESLGTDELQAANVWRWAAVASLSAGAAWAAVVAIFFHDDPTSPLLAKLAVIVPLALMGGFCSRESGHHRRTGRWAKSVSAQLRTLDAFTAPLPEGERAEVMLIVARRAFASQPDPVGDGASGGLLTESLQDAIATRLR